MKVSEEEALAKRKESTKLTYFHAPYLSYEVMDAYPDMPTEAWLLASWFYEFYCQPNNPEKIGDWLWVSGKAPISRLYAFHIRDTTTVTKLFRWLCDGYSKEGDTRPHFLEKKVFPAPEKACGKKVCYRPLPMLIALCEHDVDLPEMNHKEVNGFEEETPPEEWIPSDDLKKFREGFYEKNNDYVASEFFKKDGSPTKYWQDIETYIQALKEGTFISQFGERFTDKVKELPPLSLSEIIDIAASVRTPKEDGKPNVKEIFTVFDGKFSRFVNKYYKEKPALPDLDPAKVAKWRENYPYIDQEGYGLTQLYGKIKGLTKEWDWAYYIADKVESFYDDDQMASLKDMGKTMLPNQKKAFVKLWLEAYKGYQEQCKKWKKEPKWETLEEWVADTKVGESRIMSPWYLTAAHIYRTRGWWIIDSKSAQEAIKKFIEMGRNKGDY